MRSTTLIGVPSGVGDIYWCLTKLQAFKAARGIKHVTFAIQKTQHDRSLGWVGVCPFLDDARYVTYAPDGLTLRSGFCETPSLGALDAIMWPNAVVDRGERLETWLPELACDLSFKIETEQTRDPGDVVLYASSDGVNRAWFPRWGVERWIELAEKLEAAFGRRPLLIGSAWDAQHCAPLRRVCEPLIGRTSLPQVAGILERATVVVGVASGMTILANHFRTPCVAFFPDKHHVDFPRAWVAPDAPYWPVFAKTLERLGATAIAQQAAFLSAGVTEEDPPGSEQAIAREAL